MAKPSGDEAATSCRLKKCRALFGMGAKSVGESVAVMVKPSRAEAATSCRPKNCRAIFRHGGDQRWLLMAATTFRSR